PSPAPARNKPVRGRVRCSGPGEVREKSRFFTASPCGGTDYHKGKGGVQDHLALGATWRLLLDFGVGGPPCSRKITTARNTRRPPQCARRRPRRACHCAVPSASR